MNIDSVYIVLNNLKCIVNHKKEIMDAAMLNKHATLEVVGLQQAFSSTRINPYKPNHNFTCLYGVCSNANLWLLDESYWNFDTSPFFGDDFECYILQELLFEKFFKDNPNNDGLSYGDFTDPIGYTYETKWLNPNRWLLVDYLIDLLQKIVDHNKDVEIS